MRIAQITDLHLGDSLAKKFRIDTRDNFERVLAVAIGSSVDHIILTGDFGEAEEHDWILEKLHRTGLPFDVVLGNHDTLGEARRTGIASRPSNGLDEYHFAASTENGELLFLDSSSGALSPPQRKWLEHQIARSTRQVLVFCHHPILDCNPILDRSYGMADRDEIERILLQSSHPVSVFSGHYHSHLTSTKKHLRQYVAPASVMQIRGEGETIRTESFHSGFQLIEVTKEAVECHPRMLYSERAVRDGE